MKPLLELFTVKLPLTFEAKTPALEPPIIVPLFWLLTKTPFGLVAAEPPPTMKMPSSPPVIVPEKELSMVIKPLTSVMNIPASPPVIRLPTLPIKTLPPAPLISMPVFAAPVIVPPVLKTVTLPPTEVAAMPSWPPVIKPEFRLSTNRLATPET